MSGSIRAGKRPRVPGGKAWARTFAGAELSVHPPSWHSCLCCRDSNHEVKAGLVPEWASCMSQPGEHSDSEPWLLSSGCKQTEQGGFHGTPGLLVEAPSSWAQAVGTGWIKTRWDQGREAGARWAEQGREVGVGRQALATLQRCWARVHPAPRSTFALGFTCPGCTFPGPTCPELT